ncbi:MAG: hypothetical protein Q4G24_08625 [Paracoccus sp. (in: a-proteobacteria)]|uniref:hypothetical protein n=1 Tax=Paracoccus sp. TaxID=267 RepID=UPI0026E0C301|nr:hypothetical protein [Paracoccus sp. (in: a-proteobacteria)]MDO5621518.1 hypothetical protein [Paracoccus sp. (in: a-proteobacteria)]
MKLFSVPAALLTAAFSLPVLAQAPDLAQTAGRLRDGAESARDAAQRINDGADRIEAISDDIAALAGLEAPAEDALAASSRALEQASNEISVAVGSIYGIVDQVYAVRMKLAPEPAEPEPEAEPEPAPETSAETATPTGPAPDLALSRSIGRDGITGVQARLAALADPSPEERFALAGLTFLQAVEGTLQTRWRVGLSHDLADLPLLRLPLPSNPAAEPVTPGIIRDIMAAIPPQMQQARAPLAGLGSDFGLDIDFADLWFDINANGSRDSGEDLAQIAGQMFGVGPEAHDGDTTLPVMRFDLADAAWLSAYTHLLSGSAQVVLTYDPTDSIARVMETRAAFAALPPGNDGLASIVDDLWIDTAAAVLFSLRSQPDTAQAQAAHASFLAMIADNRIFWQRVAAETDNTREWIPNDSQQSATGVALPPETGTAWLAVLDEVEAILKGELLIPYWRSGGGLNIGRMFTDPRPIDLIDWIQGAGALPYIETGPLADGNALNQFNTLLMGDGVFAALWLN